MRRRQGTRLRWASGSSWLGHAHVVMAGQLLLSTHHHVWLMDMQTGEFTPFEPLKDHHNVKSANYDAETGALVYTIAEESWWTHHVYGVDPAFQIDVPDIRAYKVRVVQ